MNKFVLLMKEMHIEEGYDLEAALANTKKGMEPKKHTCAVCNQKKEGDRLKSKVSTKHDAEVFVCKDCQTKMHKK